MGIIRMKVSVLKTMISILNKRITNLVQLFQDCLSSFSSSFSSLPRLPHLPFDVRTSNECQSFSFVAFLLAVSVRFIYFNDSVPGSS